MYYTLIIMPLIVQCNHSQRFLTRYILFKSILKSGNINKTFFKYFFRTRQDTFTDRPFGMPILVYYASQEPLPAPHLTFLSMPLSLCSDIHHNFPQAHVAILPVFLLNSQLEGGKEIGTLLSVSF